MNKVTIDQIMGWQPCSDYPRERVEELMDGREAIAPEEIAQLDIEPESILWALLHLEFLSEFDLRELACDFAERIAIKRDCAEAIAFLEKIRAWNRGKLTDDEFSQIRASDMAAYRAAYWGPYWAADRAADRDADWAAYGAASRAADWDADERLWQIQHTLERIREVK